MDASEFDTLQKYFGVKSQIPETNLITTRAANPRVLILFSIACAPLFGASFLGLEGVLGLKATRKE